MKQENRHQAILYAVMRQGYVSIESLAEELGVSSQTIRRDISELDRTGMLERRPGGASCRTTILNSTYDARQVEDFDLCAAHDVVHGQGDGLQSGCAPIDGVPVYHASVGVDLRTAQDGGLERDGPAYASFARQAQERYGLCRVLVDGREVRVGVPRVHRLHLYFIRLFGFQGRGGDGEARGRAVMHIARFARLCLVVGQVQG